MACISEMQTTKDGRRYWLIRVYVNKERGYRKKRFYWPMKKNGDPVAKSTAEKQRDDAAEAFERECKAGEVLSRKEKKEQEATQQAELAKLKTVKQYAEGVYMPSKAITVTENTRANYQQFLDKHIYPAIGSLLLSEITPAMVTKILLDYQKKGYAHASCVKLYNILNGLFEMAFLDDTIPMSPMLKVKRPTQNKDNKEKPESEKALTAQEVNFVLTCVDAEYREALRNFERGYDKTRTGIYSALLWRTFIEVAADTGARRGELCGLKWSDISFKKKTVTISRNLQYTAKKGIYVTTPKNGKARVIDIGEDTVAWLKALQDEQSAHRLSEWVFSQEGTADPIHPQSPTRYFKKFGERYGIPNFHPHLMRHTSASMAITHGADVASVSQRLGHSDTAVTLRMYTHANEESVRAAGQAARDAIKNANKKEEAAGK